MKLALRDDTRNTGQTIVTVLCDGGDRYSSKLYNKEWLREQGLLLASQDGSMAENLYLSMEFDKNEEPKDMRVKDAKRWCYNSSNLVQFTTSSTEL